MINTKPDLDENTKNKNKNKNKINKNNKTSEINKINELKEINGIPKSTNDYVIKVCDLLKESYPDPKTELVHSNEYELSIAVMLSAQTTDKKVNQVTPKLFEKYPNWEALANASVSDVIPLIRQVNFHKGKSHRIIEAAKVVLSEFGGKLPKTISELIRIPGVARKSANVILQELWDITEGIVVDTHVTRLSNLLCLSKNKDPKKIEIDLINIIPRKYWRNISGALVLHGRYVCIARKPKCEECILNKICPSAFKN